jgi:hypothetical protein
LSCARPGKLGTDQAGSLIHAHYAPTELGLLPACSSGGGGSGGAAARGTNVIPLRCEESHSTKVWLVVLNVLHRIPRCTSNPCCRRAHLRTSVSTIACTTSREEAFSFAALVSLASSCVGVTAIASIDIQLELSLRARSYNLAFSPALQQSSAAPIFLSVPVSGLPTSTLLLSFWLL